MVLAGYVTYPKSIKPIGSGCVTYQKSIKTMVLAMLIFGGPVLHYFAIALTIGIVFGIYSSIFVMAPITLWLGIKREDLIRPIKRDEDNTLSP